MKASPSHIASFAVGVLLTLGVVSIGKSQAQSPNHTYELRIYHAMPGKLAALQQRFRNDTIRIFDRLNMKSVGYWVPQDAPDSDNLLIYVLEHPSRQAAEKNWNTFNADPEWLKAKAASETNGKLVDHVDSYYMNPTDYSKIK